MFLLRSCYVDHKIIAGFIKYTASCYEIVFTSLCCQILCKSKSEESIDICLHLIVANFSVCETTQSPKNVFTRSSFSKSSETEIKQSKRLCSPLYFINNKMTAESVSSTTVSKYIYREYILRRKSKKSEKKNICL